MSGKLLIFAGSLAGVVFLVLAAMWLRLGSPARLASEDEARELADNALCGFTAEDVALDKRGHGALLVNRSGHVLLLVPHGAHFAARMLDANTHTGRNGDSLTIETGEGTFPEVTLQLGEKAEIWEKRLSAL